MIDKTIRYIRIYSFHYLQLSKETALVSAVHLSWDIVTVTLRDGDAASYEQVQRTVHARVLLADDLTLDEGDEFKILQHLHRPRIINEVLLAKAEEQLEAVGTQVSQLFFSHLG